MDNQLDTFYPKNRQEWRDWLHENHNKKQSVWLIYYKKKSNKPTVIYSEAVEEALCFGWIDSRAKPIDEVRFMQFFCKRKPKSVWSKVNKEKIERLTQAGLMAKAGFESIEIAKQNGYWSILDDVEALIIPADLEVELDKLPIAKTNFLNFSRTDKRNILQWIRLAKKDETRINRINEIVTFALQNLKPKQFTIQKK